MRNGGESSCRASDFSTRRAAAQHPEPPAASLVHSGHVAADASHHASAGGSALPEKQGSQHGKLLFQDESLHL